MPTRPYSVRPTSGILVRLGAAMSLPSRSYVQAWYGHWKARLTSPLSSVQSLAPRCRQTLKKARMDLSRERVTRMLSRPTSTVRKAPGLANSEERATQNHIVSKMRSCSWAKIPGSV